MAIEKDKEEQYNIKIVDGNCDRCNKHAELRPYKWSKVIYKNKQIFKPWLCLTCFKIEKEKAWKEKRVYGVHTLDKKPEE